MVVIIDTQRGKLITRNCLHSVCTCMFSNGLKCYKIILGLVHNIFFFLVIESFTWLKLECAIGDEIKARV